MSYEKRKETKFQTNYKTVYHLTNYEGFAHSISSNSLQSLSQSFITTNPNMNGVMGRSHYHFKFVLDAKKLVTNYGGFENQAYVQEIGRYDSKIVPNWVLIPRQYHL